MFGSWWSQTKYRSHTQLLSCLAATYVAAPRSWVKFALCTWDGVWRAFRFSTIRRPTREPRRGPHDIFARGRIRFSTIRNGPWIPLLYLTLIRPIRTCGLPIGGTCSNSEFRRIEQQQNSTLQRRIIDIPPYVRNHLRRPQGCKDTFVLIKYTTSFIHNNQDHPNAVEEFLPPPSNPRLRRPRYIFCNFADME